ncbi:Ig-like domain-containing protein [Paenibacillus sp. PL91]|uniref:Ig-like domain-containing protein n=1 Tax=Paenibacillus sp. PL91 TaxID=2729538 RepID=UPI00145DC640|nr:Ig-like domain-containing protein [Paenibacillus sp. PL91]MBC9202232.1 Ig-like domain-containing protein [Paenibacillus sp. PL91]
MMIMKKAISLFLVFALIMTASGMLGDNEPAAAAEAVHAELQAGDYENSDEVWDFLLGTEFPGAQGSYTRDQSAFQTGLSSAKVTGDFNGGGSYVALERYMTKRIVPGDAVSLSFWVKTADASSIYLVLMDGTNQNHSQRLVLQPTTDWQKVTVNAFNAGSEYMHWGGANDGAWHPSLKKMTIKVARAGLRTGLKSGSVWFDDLRIKVAVPDLAIAQTQVGNVFSGKSKGIFDVLTTGDTVTWQTSDAWGEPGPSGSAPVTGGKLRLEVPVQTDGYYRLKLTAYQSGTLLKTAETTFATVPAFDLAAVTASPFGVQTHFAHSWNREMIPLVKYAGAKSVRDAMFWSEIELKKGIYTYNPKFTLYMEGLLENSVDPLMTFAFSNQFYDNFQTPYSAEAHAAYANYTKSLLNRFGGQIKWGEMWNEFNLPSFGGNGPAASQPDVYFNLMKAGYEAAKEVRPDLNVLGGATAGIPTEWLEDLFELGGLNYMDTLSVHPYRYPDKPEGLLSEVASLNQLVRTYNNGQTKPIWFSEIGWPTQLDPRGVDEKTQAAYLIRTYVLGMAAGVEKIFWYDLMDDGTDKKYNEHNFGIIHNGGDPLGAYTPKPGYVALATVARQLTGASLTGQEIANGIYRYKFKKDDKTIHVLWSGTDTETNLTLKTKGSLVVTDMMGRSSTYTPKDGEIYITASSEPLFVQGKIDKVVQGSKYALKSEPYFTGDPVSVTLSVYKASSWQPLNARIQLQGTVQNIQASSVGTYNSVFPGISEPGKYTATAELVIGGKKVGALKNTVVIRKSEELSAKHVLKDGSDFLRVRINNTKPIDRRLTQIDWQVGETTESVTYDTVLPGLSDYTIDLPIPALPVGTLTPHQLTVYLEDGTVLSLSGNLKNVAVASMTPIFNRTVQVDGSLDDVDDLPGIDLFEEGNSRVVPHNGPEDLSGNLWITYDNDHLYLSAKVHDDQFTQTKTGDAIWSGDSIQFAISLGTPGEAAEWYEYGMALTPNGPELYRWMAMTGVLTGPVTNRQLEITRDEASKDTIYQLALPWTELSPIAPSDGILSLSALVNENDGNGRKGWLEWGGGIGSNKQSKLFKPMLIGGQAEVSVSGITLDRSTLELTVGDPAAALLAAITPENAASKEVTWTTSDPNVATVNGGEVTAVGAGTATITATTADGLFTASCLVTVAEAPIMEEPEPTVIVEPVPTVTPEPETPEVTPTPVTPAATPTPETPAATPSPVAPVTPSPETPGSTPNPVTPAPTNSAPEIEG